MYGGSSLNLLSQDIVRKMGIDPSRIKPTKTTFKGVIPGVEAYCIGSITLEVVFGSQDNFQSKKSYSSTSSPSAVVIMHCTDELHLLISMRYRTMPTLSSRCLDLAVL